MKDYESDLDFPHTADVDLGGGHLIWFYNNDDRERVGLFHQHPFPGQPGHTCLGSILFDTATTREAFPTRHRWQVKSTDPLTVTPSLLCSCGDHGFITEGRWVPA